MKGFWANECDLFLKDLDNIADFFMQPVTLDGLFKNKDLMLKPSADEIKEKAADGGFWGNEWNLFLKDLDNVADFLFQPVKFK